VTEFSIPSAASSPQGIASGADGNLWFTESSAAKIGRVTTAGVITEFPLSNSFASPYGIAAGPDGALWFSESGASKIGRITTAGSIREYSLPITTRIFDIAAGPDGNLWFTEFDANRIGRIDTAGGISEYFIPTTDSGPYAIAAGPDGAMWFTEFRENRIGKITPPPPPPPASLFTVTPCRLVDTRNASGPLGGPALVANTDRLFTLSGVCGVPAGARAVAVNVAVTSPASGGNLTVYPAGTPLPVASTINYRTSQTRANNAVIALGTADSILVHCSQATGAVHFILDVTGYFP
jgi:hypothetical protein